MDESIIPANIKTPEQFANEVEDLVWDKDVSYLEAVMIYAEESGVELDVIAELVNNSSLIKAKITEESESLRLIQRSPKLFFE